MSTCFLIRKPISCIFKIGVYLNKIIDIRINIMHIMESNIYFITNKANRITAFSIVEALLISQGSECHMLQITRPSSEVKIHTMFWSKIQNWNILSCTYSKLFYGIKILYNKTNSWSGYNTYAWCSIVRDTSTNI